MGSGVRVLGTTYQLSAEDLRCLRRDRGLSQTQVAEAAGVLQSTVSRWERGLRPVLVDAAHLPALLDLLATHPTAA